jgi:YVTN family beta-propeller protein
MHPRALHRLLPFFAGRFPMASLICVLLGSLVFGGGIPAAHAQSGAPRGRLITCDAVAVNSHTHKVYAVDEGAGRVIVTNERTGRQHAVKVGATPISLAINNRTNRIYVINTSDDSISVIDGARDAVVATVKIRRGSHPYVLAVNEATNKIYVATTYSDSVNVIDGATNSVRALKVGAADGIAIDQRSNTIFLMRYEDPNIRIINGANGANGAVSKVRVGPHQWGMAFDQALATLYVAHTGRANVVALNEKTRKVSTIAVGEIPCAVAVNPPTQTVYVVNYGDSTLSVIDAKTQKVMATLPVGKHAQAVAVDTVHNLVYVANLHGNSVTVIDGASKKVVGNYEAGRNPYALAVDPTTGRVYAANYGEPAVTALDMSSLVSSK